MRAWFYHYGASGIAHYRVWQPFKYVKEWIEAHRLPDDTERIQMPVTGFSNVPGVPSHEKVAKDNDIIVSTYVTSPQAVARLYAQGQMTPVVIDIDDDIFSIDKSHTDARRWNVGDSQDVVHEVEDDQLAEYRKKAQQTGAQILEKDGKYWYVHTGGDPIENVTDALSNADGITVSTNRLANLYRKYNSNVCVIPNGVDPDIYPEITPSTDGKIRLGMFGANAHYYDWEVAIDGIKRVLKENKNCVLCVNTWKIEIGEKDDTKEWGGVYTADFLKDIPDDQLEVVHFKTIFEWHEFLARSGVNIGISPLVDTMFNRSKSNLKYLEWSALGIPGVYSDVEPYSQAVTQGVTGYLAKPGEWYKYVSRLVKDETLRRIMGAKAKNDVLTNHHQRDISKVLADFLIKVRKDYEKAHPDRAAA